MMSCARGAQYQDWVSSGVNNMSEPALFAIGDPELEMAQQFAYCGVGSNDADSYDQ
jgi:hypothetical protein